MYSGLAVYSARAKGQGTKVVWPKSNGTWHHQHLACKTTKGEIPVKWMNKQSNRIGMGGWETETGVYCWKLKLWMTQNSKTRARVSFSSERGHYPAPISLDSRKECWERNYFLGKKLHACALLPVATLCVLPFSVCAQATCLNDTKIVWRRHKSGEMSPKRYLANFG